MNHNTVSTITGVFVSRGKEDALVTLNMVPGETVYGEKRISVEVSKAKYSNRLLNIVTDGG